MNLLLLKSFVALAESLHFGEASRQLHLSQPALTKQIKRLEVHLGAPLFVRSRHGTQLTDVGRLLLDEAHVLLGQTTEMVSRVQRAARGEVGHIAIGFSFSTVGLLSQVLPRFRLQYPDVDVSLHDLSSAAQMQQLIQGSLQIGFVRLPALPGLSHRRILSDRLALVIPRSLQDKIMHFDVEALRDLPFLLLHRERAPGLHDHIMRLCALHHFQPKVVQHANESLTILSLGGAGVGVSVMHESALRTPGDDVICLPIEDRSARWDVGLVWRSGHQGTVVQKFIELISAVAPQSGTAQATV